MLYEDSMFTRLFGQVQKIIKAELGVKFIGEKIRFMFGLGLRRKKSS